MNLQRQWWSKLGYAAAVGLCVFLLFFVIGVTWIGFDVKSQCRQAQSEYGADCVTALLGLLADEQRGFRARNDAIWALGQLGDRRALPLLEGLYTGSIPPREPLDAGISQYELRKAINLAGGGSNPLALLWRHGIDLAPEQ